MADKVRIGIIGVGQIGTHHLEGYVKIPEAEVVAVADVREDHAKATAQKFGVPSVYTDYKELLQRDDIQSVDVCLHNRLHAPVTIDAFLAGKNVYCEKPMSWTYADAKAMYDTAKRLGRMLHVQLFSVFRAQSRAAKRLIEDGQLGDIYYAKTRRFRRRGRPFVDGYGSAAFVNKATAGGGTMLDTAVYTIGMMVWLLGNPELVSVTGSTYANLDNMYPDRRESSKFNVDEIGAGFVRFANGISYFLEEAWAIHSGEPDRAYVYGSKGGIRVDPLAYFTTLSDMEMDGTFDIESADTRWHSVDPLTAGIDDTQRHWIWAQLGRVPLIDTAGILLNTAKITEGVYLSQHLGREVTAEEIEKTPAGFGRE